jgi:hypothetical protein
MIRKFLADWNEKTLCDKINFIRFGILYALLAFCIIAGIIVFIRSMI